MLLSRKIAFLFTVPFAIACRESTTPMPQGVARAYELESVDGRPVPTNVYAGPTDTTRILFATVVLDVDGSALRTERWRHSYPPNKVDESTVTFNNEYRIDGDDITIGTFESCGPAALCEGPRIGKITATTLTLSYANNPTAPVFLYRIGPGF